MIDPMVECASDLKTTMWQFVAFTALREAFPCE